MSERHILIRCEHTVPTCLSLLCSQFSDVYMLCVPHTVMGLLVLTNAVCCVVVVQLSARVENRLLLFSPSLSVKSSSLQVCDIVCLLNITGRGIVCRLSR